ncbi:MAG: type I restriction endonuclease [Chloroflexota bacterium]
MDFIDKLRELAALIPKQVEHIRTEEATKSALVMPFINALGFNVFDPTEVTPEFVADVGVKKGEKVDYVILKDAQPIMMFECKAVSTDLDKITPSQLYRYFSVTSVRIGVLTNGIVYRFFSDLEEKNKMDTKPFLELNMLGIEEPVVEQLKKFTKQTFDVEDILTSASEFKYTREIKRILATQFQAPTDDFIRYFGKQVYSGVMTQSVREQFSEFLKRAYTEFINDQIAARLQSVIAPTPAPTSVPTPESMIPAGFSVDVPDVKQPDEVKDERQVVTTAEELEAYYIVKAIVRESVDSKRIVLRDALSYCAVLFDDNNRKPICRFWFNGAKKYIGFFDEQKQEEKVGIEVVDDIYKHTDRLRTTAGFYLKPEVTSKAPKVNGTNRVES